MVIAHAGMNARTVMLWTAEEQKFFSEYGTDIDLGKRRGIAALCIGGGERWRWWWSESIEGSLRPPFLGLPVIR